MENKESNFHERFLKVQAEIKAIEKSEVNPHFKNSYFDINALLREVKPVLNWNGMAVSQPIDFQGGKNVLCTIVSDGKDEIRSTMALPDIQDPQKLGSAITYYRRYALQSLLALEAEDDDANGASQPAVVSRQIGGNPSQAKAPQAKPLTPSINPAF